ncbi:hypothetical protein EVAR_62459_1 [Eumeta japonica]|uniref:Uncharacterized protein n=1 Tax=Eumeta variegata TaxID=151549 RepID=A0A4C1ZQR6_EUMVA|nr:hypothetical protein EVAR_62459_1 [Eumeta japonica]
MALGVSPGERQSLFVSRGACPASAADQLDWSRPDCARATLYERDNDSIRLAGCYFFEIQNFPVFVTNDPDDPAVTSGSERWPRVHGRVRGREVFIPCSQFCKQ